MTDSTASERVGRYQLLEPIGTGPTGAVSRAKVFGVAGFERQFAVKRFLPEITGAPANAQALSAAARSYGGLEHPRIARMAEFGVSQGVTFTAVELVPGLDALRLVNEARLAGTTLATGGALALVSQAARAIGYAHGRGISHLGLAPTNVIVTADGDIKITDFAILAATLPANPIETPRLAQRVGYLAPEQIAGESTSAATDVFALGVLAYELVSSQRAFKGDTPQAIAHAIVAGPPAELPLPRPIIRVLQRCLARSPFERFPDARALADALDAALRVAPVPGSRKDIGALVKEITDRLAALNEGQMSGVLSLNVGTGPIRRIEQSDLLSQLERDAEPEFPGATHQDLPRPNLTVPGLAPPPIPIPHGVAPPGSPPSGPPISTTTLAGTRAPTRNLPPKIPDIKPINRPISSPVPTIGRATPPPLPRIATEPPVRPDSVVYVDEPTRPAAPIGSLLAESARAGTEEVTRPGVSLFEPSPVSAQLVADALSDRARTALDPPKRPTPATGIASVESQRDIPTTDMPPLLAERLAVATMRTTGEIGRAVDRALSEHDAPEMSVEPFELSQPNVPEIAIDPMERISAVVDSPLASAQLEALPLRPLPLDSRADAPPLDGPAAAELFSDKPVAAHAAGRKLPPPEAPLPADLLRPKRKVWPFALLGVLVLGGGAVGAWQAGVLDTDDSGGSTPSTPARDAAVATASKDAGGAVAPADATVVAMAVDAGAGSAKPAPTDAGAAKPAADAAVALVAPDAATTTVKVTPGDGLQINSTPSGARVFIDGSDQGVTPAKLAGTADHHTVALILPSHDLYVANIDGHGSFDVQLKEVTPPNGPAGIKVIKCKDKDRYYVFVDGKPTGQTCPTERIGCETGTHTVEVYDVQTDSRKKWDINVTDTRLSFRVRIEN